MFNNCFILVNYLRGKKKRKVLFIVLNDVFLIKF